MHATVDIEMPRRHVASLPRRVALPPTRKAKRSKVLQSEAK